MNLKDPARVLDEISDTRLPETVDLLPGIKSKIERENRAKMKIRLRLAALLLAVVLLIAFFSLPGVASALKKMIGFIPGVGAVDQSVPLRVLDRPVTDTRGEFTITVESALLDPTQTVLNYRISGPIPTWADPSLEPQMCQEYPILRLSDGDELRYPRREGSTGGGEAVWKDVFHALPAGETSAVLIFPCLTELPTGEGPLNWEIPLAFAPAPPELTFYPVVELPTVTGEISTPVADTPAPPIQPSIAVTDLPTEPPLASTKSGFADWAQLTVEGIAVLEDGYYLQAVLKWKSDPSIYTVDLFPDAVILLDAAGQDVSVWQADMSLLSVPAEEQKLALNLQTAPVLSPGPARLVVNYVGVWMPADTTFTINVGDDPRPGQTWEINQDLDINGYALRVVSAEYIQAAPGEPPMLMIYLASDSGILMANAMDTEHEILGTGGSPGSAFVPFRAGWRYKNGFPKGTVTVTITGITVQRSGPWSTTWTPPSAQPDP